MAQNARLLIASLGNPSPLHNTRHSAGHILFRVLLTALRFPPLRRDSSYGGGVSSSPDTSSYTFYQSPSLMNASGPSLLKAWKRFTQSQPPSASLGLVVLHDELELQPGQLKIKYGGQGSAKGHNGVKSVQASLRGAGVLDQMGDSFVKVGIGIGRPVSRERDEVSSYVLGHVTGAERVKMEGCVKDLEEILRKETERIGNG